MVYQTTPFPEISPLLTVLGVFFIYKILRFLKHFTLRLMETYSTLFYRPQNYYKKYGDWAAVTGCTAGIGEAIAIDFARRGCNVVLISRNEEKLTELANSIKNKFHIQTKIIVNDAYSRESSNKMASELSKLNIGILVNNVGVNYNSFQPKILSNYCDVDSKSVYKFITVNMGNFSIASKHVLPNMIAAKRGLVINICSASTAFPFPLLSLYSATKIYMDILSKALHKEVQTSFVYIQSITPLLVQSNMTQSASNLFHNILSTKSDRFARNVINIMGSCQETSGYWLCDVVTGIIPVLNKTFLIYLTYYISSMVMTALI